MIRRATSPNGSSHHRPTSDRVRSPRRAVGTVSTAWRPRPGPRSGSLRAPDTARRSRARCRRPRRVPGPPSHPFEGACAVRGREAWRGAAAVARVTRRAPATELLAQARMRHRPVATGILDEHRWSTTAPHVGHRQFDDRRLPGGDLGDRDPHHERAVLAAHAQAVPDRDGADGEEDADRYRQEDELLDAVDQAGDRRDRRPPRPVPLHASTAQPGLRSRGGDSGRAAIAATGRRRRARRGAT